MQDISWITQLNRVFQGRAINPWGWSPATYRIRPLRPPRRMWRTSAHEMAGERITFTTIHLPFSALNGYHGCLFNSPSKKGGYGSNLSPGKRHAFRINVRCIRPSSTSFFSSIPSTPPPFLALSVNLTIHPFIVSPFPHFGILFSIASNVRD